MTCTYEQALEFAAKAHHGQERANGEPYICHLIRVAGRVEGEDAKIVAVLHDVLEDCEVEIRYFNNGCRLRCPCGDYHLDLDLPLVSAVLALSRDPGSSYRFYVDRLAKGLRYFDWAELACKVKLADLADNLTDLPESLESLRPRYLEAQRRIREALGVPAAEEVS